MRNYSFYSEFGSEQPATDQPIGLFPNKENALSALNKDMGGVGKACNAISTIGAFTFEDSGLNQTCSNEYYLIGILDGKIVEKQRLFPDGNLQLDQFKTTNAKGSFT